MPRAPCETLCAICLERIPPGMGAFRRGATYVHVPCADLVATDRNDWADHPSHPARLARSLVDRD